jgi:putative nucleotidyltransferase-like protein
VARFGGVSGATTRLPQWGDVRAPARWHDWHVLVGSGSGGRGLWEAVDRLIDRAPSEDDLRSHRLEVLAARRFRSVGRPVPEDFVDQERRAAIAALMAPRVLERVREAYDGPALVFKGPEVAARYPDPALRAYGDIDLLVPDADKAQRALLAGGFRLVGEPELYIDIHHLRPVLADGLPLIVEIHSRPKWVEQLTPPAVDRLFDSAEPSATGVTGMLAPVPAAHALLLAVHSWAHEPLRRLRDLIDVAAVAAAADADEINRLAQSWHVDRVWRTTLAAVQALLGERPTPWALRLWAQNLARVRERTVLENHLQRWLSDFWALPPRDAVRGLPQTFVDEVGPGGDEGWREKVSRTALAVRNASRRRSQHDRQLDERTRR